MAPSQNRSTELDLDQTWKNMGNVWENDRYIIRYNWIHNKLWTFYNFVMNNKFFKALIILGNIWEPTWEHMGALYNHTSIQKSLHSMQEFYIQQCETHFKTLLKKYIFFLFILEIFLFPRIKNSICMNIYYGSSSSNWTALQWLVSSEFTHLYLKMRDIVCTQPVKVAVLGIPNFWPQISVKSESTWNVYLVFSSIGRRILNVLW